jgi:hypothetical protein
MARPVIELLVSFVLWMDPACNRENVVQGVRACAELASGPFDVTTCVAIAYIEARFDPLSQGPVLRSGRRARGMLQVIPEFIDIDRHFDVAADPDLGNVHTHRGSVAFGYAAFDYWLVRGGTYHKALCHYAGGNYCASRYVEKVLRMRADMLRFDMSRSAVQAQQ